jgi:hypothetical protein
MMTALAPTTIVVAMEQLDTQLATLSERRQLLQQLLATWDDPDGNTVDVDLDLPTVNPSPAASPLATTTDRQRPPKPADTKQRKWDYLEVANVAATAANKGQRASEVLAAHYGVTKAMSYFLLKRCRELSLLDDASRPFTTEPITRASFDAEAARDRAALAAAPREGAGGRSKSWAPEPRPKAEPVAEKAPRFSTADALAAIEGAA